MGKFNELIGMKFGRLQVIEYVGKRKNGEYIVKCQCECGNFTEVPVGRIKRGDVKSCGCLFKETVVLRNKKYTTKTHGKTKTRLYRIWTNMKQRCYNPKHKAYKNYGLRGVFVCEEWIHDFQKFYDWAITNGYREDLTIDRINVDGIYEPSNCRWATWYEQQRNKRHKEPKQAGRPEEVSQNGKVGS